MAPSKSMRELHQEAQELERTLARQSEQTAESGSAADETPRQGSQDPTAAAGDESAPCAPRPTRG